jgi:hypothetical protein
LKNQKTNGLNITGHLQIAKSYSDGSEEIVFDDHNIIVSGMGVGLSYLFTASGSTTILDYQIDRFQVGTGGTSSLEVSSTNQLGSALASIADYGANSNLFLETGTQLVADSEETGKIFALIPQSKITRINDNSVRYTLVLNEDACADQELDEIGLLMKNPKGTATTKSILVAYRYFGTITKTDDFSLIFRWTINF